MGTGIWMGMGTGIVMGMARVDYDGDSEGLGLRQYSEARRELKRGIGENEQSTGKKRERENAGLFGLTSRPGTA